MQRAWKKVLRELVKRALAEDVGPADVTTLAVVDARAQAHARMVARQPMVAAGLDAARLAFQMVDRRIKVRALATDGARVKAGATLLEVAGPARGILTAERVALNFVQRLSGIATLTATYVAAVRGTGARILDTRKTTPGWRWLEKYAVACGGGSNHRMGLWDMVLIKDNHLALLRRAHAQPIAHAVAQARARYPRLKIEVEAETLAEVRQALEAGADIILLDNMPLPRLRRAVRLIGRRAVSEASGGVTLKTVRRLAESGVDCISVGALTHSAPAADVALDFED